jgi:apolipoprotein N-acyltransferase
MASASKVRETSIAVAMLILTATMVWFGNGLTPWWPLMWLAPLPLFWFALRSRWWSAALLACAAWLAGSTNLLGYIHLLHAPFGVWLANFGGLSLSVAIGVLMFRALVLRGAVWSGMIAPAALWVTLDWVRYGFTPHGTGADLAYTQLEFLPFLQLASITGPWGMTFLLQLFPAAVAVVLHFRKSEPRLALRVAGVVAGVMLVVLGYGTVRLGESGQRQSVRVGLIAADSDVADVGAGAERLLKAYATRATDLAARGAQIVVMPEKIAAVRDGDAPADDAILQSVANSRGVIIVAGELQLSPGVAGTLRYNRAKVFRPQAAVVSYDKEHMLPPFESNLTPGTEKLSLNLGQTRLGVAICKDMDFTSMSLAYADLGAQLMLVPAWDFNSDRTWHGHMAIMRGVEGGFSVARAAKNGYLTVSDDRGRVIAEARSDSGPFATLVADVPVGREHTLFQRWGNWFAWVAVGALAAALARLAGMALRSGVKSESRRRYARGDDGARAG